MKPKIKKYLALFILLLGLVYGGTHLALWALDICVIWGTASCGSVTDFSGMWVNAYQFDKFTLEEATNAWSKAVAESDLNKVRFVLRAEAAKGKTRCHFIGPRLFIGFVPRGPQLLTFNPPAMNWVVGLRAQRSFATIRLNRSNCYFH